MQLWEFQQSCSDLHCVSVQPLCDTPRMPNLEEEISEDVVWGLVHMEQAGILS